MLGVVQAARRYSLMSPAQVVVRWIGQPSSITVASCWWRGCSLGEASVGPVLVVVRDEFIEEALELALVPDQGPVQQFVANGAHPSLGERVGLWSVRWSGDD